MRFGHIAGDRMLDLVNTVAWRLGGPERAENLATFSDVLDWCTESDLMSANEAETLRALADRNSAQAARAEQERQLVIEARENVYAALFDGDPEAAARLADMYRAAIAAADLVRADGHWQWQDRETDLRLPRHRCRRRPLLPNRC